MKKLTFLFILAVLCVSFLFGVCAVDEKYGYISNSTGSDDFSGLTDAAPKMYQGKADGKGLVSMLYGGGTAIACGDFGVESNQTWDYGGKVTVTGVFDGKDYRDANKNTGIFFMGKGVTLTLKSDVVFENVLLQSRTTEKIRVTEGVTLTIKDSVEVLEGNLTIRVDAGGKAILEAGNYAAVYGEGEIVISEGVEVRSFEEIVRVGYISNSTGSDSRDGLTAATAKHYQGKVDGNGLVSMLYGGGIAVASGDFGIGGNQTWDYGGEVTVTGVYGGKDYRDLSRGEGIFELSDGATLVLKSDVIFENIMLRALTAETIRVSNGVTLTIRDSVDVLRGDLIILVDRGGKAILETGRYFAVLGEGEIVLGEDVEVLEDTLPVFINNARGNDNNSGFSENSAKALQGDKGGSGTRGALPRGGTLVVSGNFNISSNHTWDYGGPMLVTGSHDGKNYKNFNANTGIFKLKNGITMTLKYDLTLDDLLLLSGEVSSVIRVPKDVTLKITETVDILESTLSIYVEQGGKAILEGGTYKSLLGSGEKVLGSDVRVLDGTVGYISNATGSDSRDGLTAATAKHYQGQVGGSGLRDMLYGGGVAVASGDFGVNGDQTWDYGGHILLTGCYGGEDFKDFDRYTGIFGLGANSTLTVVSDLTFDDILFLAGEGAKLLVPDGVTVRITKKVDFQSNLLNVVVEKGGTAILEGGTYASVTGEGTIRMSGDAKLADALPKEDGTPKTVFLSRAEGHNRNDGLTEKTAKQYLGTEESNGAYPLLKNGGTLVVSGAAAISRNLSFAFDGPTLVTAKHDGVDYRGRAADAGVIGFYPGVTLTVGSDLTFSNVRFVASDTYSILLVKSGATLVVEESVDFDGVNMILEVEEGGKAIVKTGAFIDVRGKGDIELSDTVVMATKYGKIDPTAPAVGRPLDNVGFVSNAHGNDDNDGRSDLTPKALQGNANGKGMRNLLNGGGTFVVCGNFNISSNYTWDYGGKVTVCGSYDGKDYKSYGENTGIFKLKEGKTLTVNSDLAFDDILLEVGKDGTVRVSGGTLCMISDSVQVLDQSGNAGKCILIVDKGAAVILAKSVAQSFSVQGEGKVIQYDPLDLAGQGTETEDPKTETEDTGTLPSDWTADGSVYVSNTDGDNRNDGLSPFTPKKNFGSPLGDGVYTMLRGGGRLVLSGDLSLRGRYVWDFGGAVTVTASHGGMEYKKISTEPVAGYLRLEADADIVVQSDLTLEDMILRTDASTTVTVKGATFTVADTVQLLGVSGQPKCRLILEDGATAVLSEAAKAFFAVEGGTVLPYEQQ